MFERLFELFVHAKSGIFAGIFLIGTTGALVTATVQNGVTTITITQQPNASPSGSASPSISPSTSPSGSGTVSTSPSASPSVSPSGSPTSSPSAKPSCAPQAQAAADPMKTVDAAFTLYHTQLMHLRESNKSDAAKKTIDNADKVLKSIRQNAVKAIHASTACFRKDDDKSDQDIEKQDRNDNEQGDENDSEDAATTVVVVSASPSPSPASPTPGASPATDPKTIADQAVAAMKLVFDTAVAGLPTATTGPAKTAKPTRTAEPRSTTGHGSGKDSQGKKDD